MRSHGVREIAEEVRELFELSQDESRRDIFLDFLFSSFAHCEFETLRRDTWRYQADIMTFILYVFCPNESLLASFLAPSRGKGISQPAVSKRLYRAVERIAELHGCPIPALYQELLDAKARTVSRKQLGELWRTKE